MKLLFCVLCSLIFFGACTTEENTISKTSFWNLTPHQIKVLYFKNGSPIDDETRIISPFEKKEVDYSHQRGKNSGLLYPYILSDISDSCVMSFNDTITASHYAYYTVGTNSKAILFPSNRNVFNQNNYIRTVLKETKKSMNIEYFYYITEQDYIYARDK
jgi:hypothetical protein